jgi:hypothetical protein
MGNRNFNTRSAFMTRANFPCKTVGCKRKASHGRDLCAACSGLMPELEQRRFDDNNLVARSYRGRQGPK